MEYFIYANGQNQGPYPVEKLREMGITPDTMVWTQGMAQWEPAKKIAELKPLFSKGAQEQPKAEPTPNGQQAASDQQTAPRRAAQQGYDAYAAQQGYQTQSGAGIKEFFTDEYENEADIPVIKQWINKLLGMIDSGRFFRDPMRWLYIIIGVLVTLGCLGAIWGLIDSSAFKYQPVYAILATLMLIVVGVFALLFWINRSKRLKDMVRDNDDIVAIPVVAHFTQSAGECVGIIVGTAGALMGFLLPLLAGDMAGYAFRELIPFSVSGPLLVAIFAALFCVIYGFLIILISHFWAEMMRAIASIANSTQKIANKK